MSRFTCSKISDADKACEVFLYAKIRRTVCLERHRMSHNSSIGVFLNIITLGIFGICNCIFISSSILFLLVGILLLVIKIGVQEDHVVVHNFEELTQKVQVSIKLSEQNVYVLMVDLNHKRLSAFLVLRLDNQLTILFY